MDLSLIILLNSIAVVLVAPVVIAALYLRRQSSKPAARIDLIRFAYNRFTDTSLLGIGEQLFCFLMFFLAPKWKSLSSFTDELKLIENATEKYRLVRYRIITQTRVAEKSAQATRALENELLKSLQKSNTYEQRALENDRDALIAVLARQYSRTNYLILKRLEVKRATTFALNSEVQSLKDLVFTVLEQKVEETEKEAAAGAAAIANSVFKIPDANRRNSLMERMEQKIRDREAEVLKKFEPRKTTQEEERAGAFVAKICDFVMGLNKSWDAAKKSVTDACIQADPNIDRAYKRLINHLAQAKLLAFASQQAEDRLNRLMMRNSRLIDKSQTLQNAFDLRSDATEDEFEMQNVMNKIKIKNLVLEQTLYRVDAAVRRLDMIKLLIAALPTSYNRGPLQQYSRLTYALCNYLTEVTNPNKLAAADAKNEPINFSERLSALEESTLMAFIKIAKDNSKKLNQNAYSKLERDIATVAKAIELERVNALSEFEKWNSLAGEAFLEQRELTHTVASQRSEQSSSILKMTERTLDVLNVTISIAEQRMRDSKAG